VPRADDSEDQAWASFDAALRRVPRPDPDPGLRDRCLPPGLGPDEHVARARRVLVVEDEPAIRRLIELHLSRAGYQVAAAPDGVAALAQVGDWRPDLIILDVMMPGPDGFQVLQQLKGDPRTVQIPVVMLTAKGSDDHVRHGWQKGADFYMAKPFNPAELRSVVDRLVAVAGTPEDPAPLRRSHK
jgi:DNA-binding response OmpR family regulator